MANLYPVIKLVVFTVEAKLKVFLKDKNLPGKRVKGGLSLDAIAKNLFESCLKLKLASNYLEQLYTFSRLNNNIAIVYYLLIPRYAIPSDLISNFVNVDNINKNYSDYQVIKYAVKRLRWKIEYTNVVYSLLPGEFTFSDLQNIYEAILGRTLDKRNFKKKILSLNIIKPTGHIKKLGKARPAEMFEFKNRKLTFVQIL